MVAKVKFGEIGIRTGHGYKTRQHYCGQRGADGLIRLNIGNEAVLIERKGNPALNANGARLAAQDRGNFALTHRSVRQLRGGDAPIEELGAKVFHRSTAASRAAA